MTATNPESPSADPVLNDLAALESLIGAFIGTMASAADEAEAVLDSVPGVVQDRDIQRWRESTEKISADLENYRKRLKATIIHYSVTRKMGVTTGITTKPAARAEQSKVARPPSFEYPGMPQGTDWLDKLPGWFHDGKNGFDLRLLRELDAVGVRCYTLSEIAKLPTIPPAIPVFLDWLENLDQKLPGPEQWGRHDSPEHHKACIRGDLIRNLNDPAAKGNRRAIHVLTDQLRRVPALPDDQRYWAALALAAISGRDDFDLIVQLIRELPAGDDAVVGLLRFIGRYRTPAAKEVALRQLEHRNTRNAAMAALGRMRATDIRHRIEPFLDDPDDYTRKQARKTLAKLPE